jgi:hypothetical protein
MIRLAEKNKRLIFALPNGLNGVGEIKRSRREKRV